MSSTFTFQKATKEKAKARIALIGPSGSGKTYSALRIAVSLGQRIAVIDTENNSASLYADEFIFDTLALDSVSPQTYVKAINAAEKAGYDVLIIDSLSHAWAGKDGALAMADKGAAKYKGNTFAAWRDVTPYHNNLVDALINCQCHLIATMRTKTEYVIQKERGKMVPKKVGMAPIQRQGMEYEFDIVGDLDLDHNLIISKTRYKALDGQVVALPGEELGQTILNWLTSGAEPTPRPEKPPEQRAAAMTGKAPSIEPETPLVTPHWIEDKATDKKFWLWVINQGLTDKDVYAALKVEEVKLYAGSKAAAIAAIEAYITEKAAGNSEPSSPETLKARLKAAASKSQWGGKPTDAQRGLLIGQTEMILGGSDNSKLFLSWLFDYETLGFSRSMLKGPEVVAVLDELKPEKLDGEKYVPTNEKAVEAFKLMLRQARLDTGQQEMELNHEEETNGSL
ncbi:MAG: ATP-binding protein [Chloroflexota bacterium]